MQPIASIVAELSYFCLSLTIATDLMNTQKEITIYDIAQQLNLSPSTVSRALKGNPVINKDTQRKVVQCAERLGYQSNAFASNLRQKRTHTLGVVVPRLDSNFMSACLAGMEAVANQEGYTMLISQSLEWVDKEIQNVRTMFSNRVDGLIVSLVAQSHSLDHFQPFINKGIPVLFFDRTPEEAEFLSYGIDNYKAAYEVGKHLVDQGCKRLFHITLNSENAVYRDRYNGFCKAAEEAGLSVGKLELPQLSADTGREAAQQLLGLQQLPDGLFVANDMAAAGCLHELQAHGLNCPDDFALVGFNNDPVSTLVQPELTTVDYPGREAGTLVTRSLIHYLNGDSGMEFTSRVVLNSKLIVRNSSIRNTII